MIREKIVVIDDDISVCRLIKDYLEGEGFQIFVTDDGKKALSIIEEYIPEVVILDIILPEMDGLEILRSIREWSAVPVIMLSAYNETSRKTSLLNLGADDYLTKPFSLDELLARICAVLRRTGNKYPGFSSFFDNNGFYIDYEKSIVMIEGNEIRLTPLEYRLVEELTRNAGKILNHEYLLHTIWGSEYSEEKAYLHTFIKQVRSKIENDPKHPQYILTVPRVGYKFQDRTTYS